jgi:hypothetical protein
MRAGSIATIVAGLLFAWATAAAQGRDYPFCAYGSKSSESMRCDYSTLAQCQASIAGDGGSCIANPSAGQTAARPTAKR